MLAARLTPLSQVAALLITLCLPPPAISDVSPGDVISKDNAEKVKALVSQGVYWCVQHGLPMTIVEKQAVPWPEQYKHATEKYSAQVTLGANGVTLENYVAGQPFIAVDSNDPNAAVKIMHNFNHRPPGVDDLDSRNFDADTGPFSPDQPLQVERHFLIDHFRRLYYVGRLFVDPKPKMPNPDGIHYKETLHPLLEPFDLKGVGMTYYRYLDPAKQDDSWLYLPSLRRVRRLSTAQRSDALFGQDTDQDSYAGYAGQINWMSWKLLGEQDTLGVFHARHFPVKWAAGAADWVFDDVWEKRPTYIVEGVSKLPQYAYSKRVLYVDKEAFAISYSDIYDQAGELWKVWINAIKFATKPFAGSETSYPHQQLFYPAIVMVDMQLNHATKAALPSHRFPGETGWYFNFGEAEGTTEDQFTIAELIASGR